MNYKHEDTHGRKLRSIAAPFKSVVNNGYTISTQDSGLIEQLWENEIERGEVIDWFIFKVGKSVLIDDLGRKFACTMAVHNGIIELMEIIG